MRRGVIRGGWLYGYSGNRDRHLASRSALKDFTDDALSMSADSSFQKFDSTSTENVIATVGIPSLLVELVGAAAWSCAG